MTDVFVIDMQHILDGETYRTRISVGCPELITPLERFAHDMGFETVVYDLPYEVLSERRSQAEIDRGQAFLSTFFQSQAKELH